MRENYALVFQLYAEKSARELLQHRTGYFYAVLFAHKPPKVKWADRRNPTPARGCALSRCDVGSLQTLGALRHFELHLGAFIQRTVSLRLDRREVHEDVFSVLPLDKAVAFGRVKPLHCSLDRKSVVEGKS